MKSFKIFWVFLVLVFALVVFAGCQETPTPTPNPDNGNQGGENTGDHTHTWSGWAITTNPTCTAEGVETRTCECGDSETRKVDKIDHDYQLVKLVPATATTKGVQEHYECSMCHKSFNANKQEVTSASLEFDGVSGTYVYSPVLGVLNAYGDIQIYDGSVAIDKGDIAGYVFGINAQGKIIYASYYGDGYGGPSDGFYHDGTYQLTIGEVCGIFDVSSAFQAWPATTTVNGEQVNAWTLYDVVAPTGGYLISIKRGAADEFIKALTGAAELENEGNTLFESTIGDGALNHITFNITKGIKNAAITATTTTDPNQPKQLASVKVSGAANETFTLDSETGKYEGTFSLSTIWSSVNFDLVYSDQSTVRLTVNNTTINGNGICNVKLESAPYDVRLYADEDDQIASGTFFYSLSVETNYKVVYDPETSTMTIETYEKVVIGDVAGVRVTGEDVVNLAYNSETGLFEGRFTLSTEWATVVFDLVMESGATSRMTYSNTTFTGTGICEELVPQATWTARLYTEENSPSVVEGKFWYSIANKTTIYVVTYSVQNKTLSAEIYVPEATVTEDSFVLDGTTKVAIAEGVTIYDSTSQNITFGEYTIAVDGNGKIVFASRTSSGYGGPGDGFYHDGTYQVVVGQVCGIFYIKEGFKSWGECTPAERNQEVKPWSLYTRVCPENYHIITGSQSAMSNLIKAICNIDTFNESGNGLFENTIADGTLTVVITFEFKE